MTTSVVIPVYNGLKFLKSNLSAVVNLNASELIIVDDASTDGSGEYVSKNFPKIKLITHSQNMRFPISVNDGVQAATGDIIILLNQDVLPSSDLLKNSLHHFNNPQVFAVTFNEQDRSWADAKFTNGFMEFKNGLADNKSHISFWPSGGSSAIRKSMWDELSGFDPQFTPGYFEDFDLGWRANNKGWQTIWDPAATVTHAHPESTFNTSFQKKQLQRVKDRNFLLSHWKNVHADQWPSHICFLLLRIIKSPGYLVPTLMAILVLFAPSPEVRRGKG